MAADDMVPVITSSNHDAEQEAMAIHSVLEANGLPSVLIGPAVLPVLEFRVEVERRHLEEAERIIADARAAGPSAAAEAEAEEESEGAV